MVEFTVLASGSRGNSAVLSAGSTRILLDAGLSARELCRRMQGCGIDPATLDAILITHEHSDHVRGLGAMARRLGVPVYLTEATHREWRRIVCPQPKQTYAQWLEALRARKAAAQQAGQPDGRPGELESVAAGLALAAEAADGPESGLLETEALVTEALETDALESDQSATEAAGPEAAGQKSGNAAHLPEVCYLKPGEPFSLGAIEVHPFTIPHDAADPVGYVFRAEGVRVGVATDLGYVPPNVAAQLQGCDLLMLESNHDLDMLRDGPYPWSVKQRVLSRVGHLSNDAAAEFLEQNWDGRAGWVILAHLSESNNLPEIARLTAERALERHAASLFGRQLLLAQQDEPLSPIAL